MGKTLGKIALKILAATGILGLSGLGVKIANDIGNSAYKDLKDSVLKKPNKEKVTKLFRLRRFVKDDELDQSINDIIAIKREDGKFENIFGKCELLKIGKAKDECKIISSRVLSFKNEDQLLVFMTNLGEYIQQEDIDVVWEVVENKAADKEVQKNA